MITHHIEHIARTLCILALAASAGCSPEREEAGGRAAEVTVSIIPDGYGPTKSSYTWDEDGIRDIQVVVTTGNGDVHAVLYSDTPSTLQFTGMAGRTYKLWAAVNLGGKVEVRTLEDFTEGVRNISFAGIEGSGIPMFSDGGVGVTVTGNVTHAVVPVSRMMARVDFKVKKDRLDSPGGFRVRSERVLSPVDSYTPFAPSVASTHSGTPDYIPDSATRQELARLNSGGTVSLYTFENMQGTLLPGNTDPWLKVPGRIGDAGPYCTYLEVICSYNTPLDHGEDITYRMYLGEDATTNFDVRRNTVYRLTLVPTEEEIRGGRGSWKIEPGIWENEGPDEPVYTSEFEYELTVSPTSVTIGEGGTAAFTATLTTLEYSLADGVRVSDDPVSESEEDVTGDADWSVDDGSEYVSDDGAGAFSWAGGPGSATVSATYEGLSATASITTEGHETVVTYRYEYDISPGDAEIIVGETVPYTVTMYTYTIIDGVEQPGYTSETLPGGQLSWNSSDPYVASVSDGTATGIDSGTTVITATTDDGVTLSSTLMVRHVFEFTGGPSEILPGESFVLSFYTTLDPGDIDIGCSDPGFSAGYISGAGVTVYCDPDVTPGTTVTITGGNVDKGAADSWTVTVGTPPEPNPVVTYSLGVSVNGSDTSPIEGTISLIATLSVYHDGEFQETRDVTDECIWASDRPEVSVSGGVASSSSNGFFCITAIYNIDGSDYSDSCDVTFTAREYITISVDFGSDMSHWWASAYADCAVPMPVFIGATFYTWTGNYVGDMSFYIQKDDIDSQYNYSSIGVEGPPGRVVIDFAEFSGGTTEYYDAETALYWCLSY